MHGCFKALYNFANDHKETVFPGFTHLQIAQPVVLTMYWRILKIKRDKTALLMRMNAQIFAR